jgi:hypothetical protein
MLRTTVAALVCGTMLALAPVAHAEDVTAQELKDRMVFFVSPSGKVMMAPMNEAAHAMFMKYAKPLKSGTAIYRSGNKFYVLENRKMADGSMMFDLFKNF